MEEYQACRQKTRIEILRKYLNETVERDEREAVERAIADDLREWGIKL